MASEAELKKLREAIDSVDDELLKLISRRAELASEVGKAKRSAEDKTDFYRPEREAQVLRRIMEHNPGPLPSEEIARLFRELMSACLGLEMPITVAYLGPEGTFSQAAAQKYFGGSSLTEPQSSIDKVFHSVEAGLTQFGVVSVENSTEGVINQTLDRFVYSPLTICGEVELPIHHNLMIGEKTQENAISRIYSHPRSLAQCRHWLNEYYPDADCIAVESNAEAARRIQTEWNSAAIAGEVAAGLYGLRIVAENIEDHPDNTTRFLVLGNRPVPPSGDDKTSVMISLPNKSGALATLLKPFQESGVNVTWLQTRPSNQKWNYLFFIDFSGHIQDQNIQNIVHELESNGAELKVLGSYPKAVL